MKPLFVFFVSCALLVACRASAPRAIVHEGAVAALEGLIAGDNDEDLARVLAAYTEDAVWLPPASELVSGKVAIAERYRALFQRYDVRMKIAIDDVRAGARIACLRGRTNGTLVPKLAGEPILVDDKFLAVLVAGEDGVWRVSHLMWSPRAPAGS